MKYHETKYFIISSTFEEHFIKISYGHRKRKLLKYKNESLPILKRIPFNGPCSL